MTQSESYRATGSFAAAKRGDLVAIVQQHHDWINDEPGRGHSQEYATVDLATVTSITRDGQVKAWQTLGGYVVQAKHQSHRTRYLIVSATKLDVAAALAAAKQHTYPGYSSPKPFDSVDEAREFLRPFALRQEVAS